MIKNNKCFVLWFTGLPSSGKTSIGKGVCRILRKKGLRVKHLDGDIIRKKLNKNLGFSRKDREKNLEIAADLVETFLAKGNIVVASFVSPYRKTRKKIREKISNFIEIFTNSPLEICEKRDIKGLYKKARLGEIDNFTGISDPYQSPQQPEIELKTDKESVQQSIAKVIKYLSDNKYL